jgi:bifunctional non-homologous end joining protein LigD
VIDYYLRAGAVLLPHLRDRLLPCPERRPDWMETAATSCVANDLPAIVWLANAGAVELHPSLALRDDLDRPTALVFDLDPGDGADLDACREVALLLRGMFDQLGLRTFPKTAGSNGIQVCVPLNTDVDHADAEPFAKAVAETLGKAARRGRVLVGWSQKAAVAPYSLLANERPAVSMPLAWDEVEGAPADELEPDPEAALARIDARGDLFAPVLTLRQELPSFGSG